VAVGHNQSNVGRGISGEIVNTEAKVIPAKPVPDASEDSREGSLVYPSYVLIVLMSCYMLSFINRQILALLVAPMKRDLHISDSQVGLLGGAAFAIFYTFAGLPLGRLVDTRSRRNLIAVGIFLWSLMTASCAAAGSFWTLFTGRIGVGVGEATLSPAAFSLIADYFPKKKLGRALSIYSMGIFLGTGLAYIIGGTVVQLVTRWQTVTVPIIGTIASWRLTFLVVGLPGLLFVLWLFTIKEPIRRDLMRHADGAAMKFSFPEVFAQARLRWQSLIGLALAMVFQSMAGFAFFSWAAAFFQRLHGWSPGHSGRTIGVMIMFFGCVGMYVGGTMSDRWQRRGVHEGPLKVGVISAVGTAIFFAAAMLNSSATWSLIFIAPALLFFGMPIGTAYASVQMIFPNQVRGQVSAFFMFVLNLGGLSLGPYLPGFFNDHIFRNEQMIGVSMTITIVGASLLQLILFRACYSHYRRDFERMHPSAAVAL